MKDFADLLPGEEITTAVGADYELNYGNVALTNKRIYFKGSGLKKTTATIGLSKISQVKSELGGMLSNSYVIIEYSGGEAKFRIHGKEEAKHFSDSVNLAIL